MLCPHAVQAALEVCGGLGPDHTAKSSPGSFLFLQGQTRAVLSTSHVGKLLTAAGQMCPHSLHTHHISRICPSLELSWAKAVTKSQALEKR